MPTPCLTLGLQILALSMKVELENENDTACDRLPFFT